MMNNNLFDKNINWHFYHVTKKDRENLHKHRSMLLWFTGLSGSGKSTLANVLEENLYQKQVSTYILDGDNVRFGLCRDLRFDSYSRNENIRRVGEVAKLMIDAGLVVIAAFISPYQSDRQMIRNMFDQDCFLEIFLDTPLKICKNRDPKGLYKQVECGKIKNFTGIHMPYERPDCPDIYLNGEKSVEELVQQLLNVVLCKIFDNS